MKKKNRNILNLVIIGIFLLCFGIFSELLFRVDLIPYKYLFIGYSLIGIISLILIFLMYRKNKIVKLFSSIIVCILSIIFGMGTIYLKNTYDFLNNTQSDYDTLSYSVVVLNTSSYNDISSLNNKIISYLDDDYKSDISSNLSSLIKYNEELDSEFGVLPDKLLNSQVDAICLEESYLTLINEEVENFSDNTKTIYTFEVKIKAHQETSSSDSSLIDKPFVLYISGIDQYGEVNSVRGRSDVNILAIVNPKTNKILLVNTPRDYYVQLDGTTGLKDKLTHAGIYGIDKSIKTLENLYDIDIDNYLRVNFNTLIKVVDIIGGIDINSDSEFTCHTNKNVHVVKGVNHFDGASALAYSRERYAYVNGDNHRGANQQQVITAIINKVTSSQVIISKYNSILNALDGSFQTDMSTDDITSFIRYQLDKMPTWDIESTAVVGSDGMDYTYSMGTNYKLYVMIPDDNSINSVKAKISEVLNETK